MKFIIKLSFLILVGVHQVPSYSQTGKPGNMEGFTRNMDSYSMCEAETNHAKLYDFGKNLAEGWLYWITNRKSEERNVSIKTKQSFFNWAFIGYTDKTKITQTGKFSPLYYCYMGYSSNIGNLPWSSVHSGLVDNLPAKHKAKFLSLPER